MTWFCSKYQFYNIFLKAIDFNKSILQFQAGTGEYAIDIFMCQRLILVICPKSYIPENGYIYISFIYLIVVLSVGNKNKQTDCWGNRKD